MIDHIGFRVRDLAASRRFYEACVPATCAAVMPPEGTHHMMLEKTGAPLFRAVQAFLDEGSG